MQSTIKIKNNVLAIPAAPDAIPVNPKTAAMSAITKKIADHFNMTLVFRVYCSLKIACQIFFKIKFLFTE